jgi:hypothetical protein
MPLIDSVNIPEGSRGKWTVAKFTVSEQDAKMTALRAAMQGRGYVPAGTYTQLTCQGRGIVMSDTPDERRDHYQAVHRATGHVLINGLGIGMVLAAILKKPDVTKVTVVEVDADVIALVGPSFKDDPRVDIVHASAFDYKPPTDARYGAVWHDIWDDLCGDNLPEMTKLKRKYGQKTKWQGCWGEYETRRYVGR